MKKINFSMDVYYDPNKIIKGISNIQQEVINRMGENDCQDLYNAIERIEDEDIFNIVESFIENATLEELNSVISVDENSIRFDRYESSECDYIWLAYLVDVTLNIEKILIQKILMQN